MISNRDKISIKKPIKLLMKEIIEKYDVAVIGGGPAGIMAAIQASKKGAKVVILEKNASLARKLLITGKGRCNITQNQPDAKEFVKKIGKKGKFLFSALSVFGPIETIEFFRLIGLPLKTERGGRVFPQSNRSVDVLSALVKYLKRNEVEIIYQAAVEGFKMGDNRIISLKLENKSIYARNYILATGGKSYPLTGSTGDGYNFATKMGHTIVEPAPALVPLKAKEDWVKDLQGLSLKNVEIQIFQNNKKQEARFGEMLFTHFGLSGPIILDASKTVGELLKNGKVIIRIDLKPAIDFEKLDARLKRDFINFANKNFENYLPELLPQKMIAVMVKLSNIDGRKKIHSITKEERKKFVHLIKTFEINVEGLMGFDHAIITSGGIDLGEIDSKTMRSKKIDNLYLAGEVLDLDGPTGGYNLQICWSTGFVAGKFATL
jgi:predicted Rossmann fold flavoprotein